MDALGAATIFGLGGAALVGLGLYDVITARAALRQILAFNVMGAGIFLVFGAIARRGAGAGLGGDPVPQALVITGIVVAFAATALACALLLRMRETTGQTGLESPQGEPGAAAEAETGAGETGAGGRHP